VLDSHPHPPSDERPRRAPDVITPRRDRGGFSGPAV